MISESFLGKPLFEMCWFYMGIAQIALDPPTLGQTGKRGKKCPKPSWQALTPPHKIGKKKSSKPSWQALNVGMWERSAPNHPRRPLHPPLPDNAHMEKKTHFKKGLPLAVRTM